MTVLGVSKHAKDAPLGVNALVRLVKGLHSAVEHSALAFISEVVGEDATGSSVLGKIEDEPSGGFERFKCRKV